jgi:hypothetical protein
MSIRQMSYDLGPSCLAALRSIVRVKHDPCWSAAPSRRTISKHLRILITDGCDCFYGCKPDQLSLICTIST